jgi:hypothetical protein
MPLLRGASSRRSADTDMEDPLWPGSLPRLSRNPAAALAALLSPCILLAHNHKDFGALGVRSAERAKDADLAAVELRFGEFQLHAVVMVPAAPFVAAAGAFIWA